MQLADVTIGMRVHADDCAPEERKSTSAAKPMSISTVLYF